jgi:hypothetical protein
VDALLEREPDRRPQTPDEARRRLEEAAEEALGVRWRRETSLPADAPAQAVQAPAPAVPHRFVSTRTLAERSPLGALAVHALTRPVNLAIAAAVAVAAVVLAAWLFAVAAAAYVALSAITFFDEAEAERAAR